MKKLLFAITLIAVFITACGDGKKQTNTSSSTESTVSSKKIEVPDDISALLAAHTCLTCHKPDEKLVGPSYIDVAKRNYADEEIVNLIYNPKPEHWPDYPPMLALKNVPQEDALKIAKWINSLDD